MFASSAATEIMNTPRLVSTWTRVTDPFGRGVFISTHPVARVRARARHRTKSNHYSRRRPLPPPPRDQPRAGVAVHHGGERVDGRPLLVGQLLGDVEHEAVVDVPARGLAGWVGPQSRRALTAPPLDRALLRARFDTQRL